MKIFGGFLSAVRDGTVTATPVVYTTSDNYGYNEQLGIALTYARDRFPIEEGWHSQNAGLHELPFLVEVKDPSNE